MRFRVRESVCAHSPSNEFGSGRRTRCRLSLSTPVVASARYSSICACVCVSAARARAATRVRVSRSSAVNGLAAAELVEPEQRAERATDMILRVRTTRC